MQQPAYHPPVQPAQPSYQQPSYQQPMQQPSYQQPMQQPSYQQPMQQPSYQQPMQQPSYQQPMQQNSYRAPMAPPTGNNFQIDYTRVNPMPISAIYPFLDHNWYIRVCLFVFASPAVPRHEQVRHSYIQFRAW